MAASYLKIIFTALDLEVWKQQSKLDHIQVLMHSGLNSPITHNIQMIPFSYRGCKEVQLPPGLKPEQKLPLSLDWDV